MNREIKAVSEAIYKAASDFADSGQPVTNSRTLTDLFTQAAIAASDSKYVKGLVEALKEINESTSYGCYVAQQALQQLPEDLR